MCDADHFIVSTDILDILSTWNVDYVVTPQMRLCFNTKPPETSLDAWYFLNGNIMKAHPKFYIYDLIPDKLSVCRIAEVPRLPLMSNMKMVVGFYCFSRKIVQDRRQNWNPMLPTDSVYFGEDTWFAYSARKLGYIIHCDGIGIIDHVVYDEVHGKKVWAHYYQIGSKIDGNTALNFPKRNDAVKHDDAKLKIALISSSLLKVPPDNYGGLEQVVCDLGETLALKGHDVTIYAPDGSKVEGCKIIETGREMGTANCDWLKAESDVYEKFGKEWLNFDVVHGHNWFGFEYVAKIKAIEQKKPLAVCHTHHAQLNQNFLARSHPFNFNLVAVSKYMQTQNLLLGVRSNYVSNGINLKRYPFQAEKNDRLLFVGRFENCKQPHVAIEIANQLNMGLDLVGGTFVKDLTYLNQIRTLCDGKRIVMHENAPHELKLQLLRNAKCLLFPSKMNEPFGLVAVEAMACGTPVIALNDGAIPEVVTEGGIVCTDIEAMAMAVKEISNIHPKTCLRNAQRFSRENMVDGYLKLYREMLNGNEW